MPLSNLINLAISTQVEAIMWTSTPTPPLLPLILTYLDPILDFLFIISYGLPSTLRYMLHHPLSVFSLSVWQSQLSAATQPWLLRGLDMQWAGVKRRILRDTRGVVLEVGAGTGETIKHYCEREGQVERIFGVEPSLKKCGILKYTAKKLGMKDKYEVVPCGIEDVEGLKRYGIEYQSVDTIHCLCSIPEPQEMIARIYQLLKPGGQLIILEHVGSNHWFTRLVQSIYTRLAWSFLLDGCEMDRDTLRWVLAAPFANGDIPWKAVELQRPNTDGWWSTFPRVYGRLTKANK